ncbi:enhancer of polycomb homolog 1-like isoform X3 [Penaeus japonicus]|uniref:enhancer of polycomb homolog 1-like isoform X3 n=1 Tax=Penaeus japonicus TaxID=27405 RepID=UPI001C7176E6|nr:enhancer of polycomb homolog 1-like isoform X3 [Penaeus japonicus]
MSKFRARQLDAAKPIPVFRQEDIPDYAEFNAINRTVPQMPTGMEKEEETEHHLQQAIFHQRIIPVPEVYDACPEDSSVLDRIYPPTYKAPRQLIHIHPFSADQDIPEYDMDSEDEAWLSQHAAKGEVPLTNLQFEEMMDRLEKASGLKAVTLQEAKVLLKDDDDLIIAVYDYWLNKRLRLAHPLIPQVKTEKGSGSNSSDPYVAFRKRTEKMQTRKNRKNDESSYEKMLKLRRDLSRAVTLLEMVKRREKAKREHLHLNIEIFERRYEMQDFSGSVLAEVSALRTQRPAFAPLFSNHQLSSGTTTASATSSGTWLKVAPVSHSSKDSLGYAPPSSEDEVASPSPSEAEEENEPDGVFTFRRKKFTNYHAPKEGNWPWVPPSEGGGGDPRFRFSLTSLAHPTRRCIGFARRRVGRGGRVWIDRLSTPLDDLWFKTDFRSVGPNGLTATNDFLHEVKTEWPHFCPSSPPEDNDTDVEIDVETVGVPVTLTPDVNLNSASSPEELNLASAVPSSVFITAEVMDGDAMGNITELEVSIPSDLDTLLSGDSGVIIGENLEVDLVTDNSSHDGKSGSGTNGGSSSSSGVTYHDLASSEWASNFSSTSDRQQQHSVDFTTQPTSKFMTLDSTNTLPLAVSGLQLSTSNVTGDEMQPSSLTSSSSFPAATSSSASSSSTSSASSSSTSSSLPPLSSAAATSSSVSLSNSSATSLSNSLQCASSSSGVSDKVGSECSNSESSGGNGQAISSQQHQDSLSADASCVPSGLHLSNNKNNGSNVISSSTTNNLVSQKLFASTTRTNDSLPNSDSNSSAAVFTNGPSNSLDSSKCAKLDHYMFHET